MCVCLYVREAREASVCLVCIAQCHIAYFLVLWQHVLERI